MAALHKAQTLPLEDRLTALARAGKLFATGEIDGMSAAAYQYTVSRMSGTPLPVVRGTMEGIAHRAAQAYRSAQQARPSGAVNDWRDPLAREGTAVWIRRGNVLVVHAPGNQPGVHSAWLEPLALGYRVAIRPSRREPLTPHRLGNARRACGVRDHQVAPPPPHHDAAEEIFRPAPLRMAHGGQERIAR